jgi:glycosyltransferase involved in cell wall biosynthesis
VEDQIARSGLAARVRLHGFVPEQVLDEAIAGAHLAFNLRHPTMGEASGGILRSWAHATPALVTDAGWYADLPDTVARKISVVREIEDLHAALADLTLRPEVYERMGLAARDRLRSLHTPEGYVRQLGEALGAWPRLTAGFAGRRMLSKLAEGARSRQEQARLLDRAAGHIAALLSPRP